MLSVDQARRAVPVRLLVGLFTALAFAAILPAARGDVVVLANRSPSTVKFSAAVGKGKGKAYEVASGDLMPLMCHAGDTIRVAYFSAGKRRDFQLHPNAIYYFHHPKESDDLDLEEIAVGALGHEEHATEAQPPAQPPAAADAAQPTAAQPAMTKVKVKILADDDERSVRAVWEKRYRKRIADASALLEKYAHVSLEVVAVDTWVTPNETHNFDELLRNFEANVKADPADVAIGFASQVLTIKGRTHMGATRGPLSKHIFLYEWSHRASESERLELLVHELGHRFGATHSPEKNSVMRPVLADRQSNSRQFRIVFDPINVLAMNLVSEEIREHKIEHLYQVGQRTRDALVSIYLTMGKAFPEDPAATQYLAMLGESPPATAKPKLPRNATLIDSARLVRDAIVDLADRNRRLPRIAGRDGGRARLAGDELTEAYVRVAAHAALDVPEPHRAKAFALGLGITLADSDALQANSLIRDLLPQLESLAERDRRQAVIGLATIQDRNDLARHFFLSAAIAELTNSSISEAAGMLKEMQDMQGKSGFSFTDLAVDFAGIALADYVRNSKAALRELSESFRLETFVPIVKGLPEGLSREAFQHDYGSTSDPRFLDQVAVVRTMVKRLPFYSQAEEKQSPKGDEKPSDRNPR